MNERRYDNSDNAFNLVLTILIVIAIIIGMVQIFKIDGYWMHFKSI